MSSTENKQLVQRQWYEELWNHWNVDAADALFTPDYRLHLAGSPAPLDRTATKEAVAMFGRAFPDLHHTVDEIVSEGNTVVARWTVGATHPGISRGFPPTRRAVTNTGITLHHIRNGQIAETWLAYDNLSFLQQLGPLAPAGKA